MAFALFYFISFFCVCSCFEGIIHRDPHIGLAIDQVSNGIQIDPGGGDGDVDGGGIGTVPVQYILNLYSIAIRS